MLEDVTKDVTCSHHVSLCVQTCCPSVLQWDWLCWLESSSPSSSLCWTGDVKLCMLLFKYLGGLHNVPYITGRALFYCVCLWFLEIHQRFWMRQLIRTLGLTFLIPQMWVNSFSLFFQPSERKYMLWLSKISEYNNVKLFFSLRAQHREVELNFPSSTICMGRQHEYLAPPRTLPMLSPDCELCLCSLLLLIMLSFRIRNVYASVACCCDKIIK